MNKPYIVCDVDGVLLDFSRSFACYWNNKYEEKIEGHPSSWDFGLKNIKLLDEEIKHFFDTKDSGEMSYVFSDTEEYFNKLAKVFNIHIVTACPVKASYFRKENLKHLNYKYISFMEKGKVDYIVSLNPEYVIEDCPEYINVLSDKLPVFFPYRLYTVNCKKGKIFHSWKELYEKILKSEGDKV